MEEPCREEEEHQQPALLAPAPHAPSPLLVEDRTRVEQSQQVTPSKALAAPGSSGITSQMPQNVIGRTLVVRGRVEFQNLLRIDGYFEGELVGNGSLIIGPTAEVISDIRGLQEVYVEGILIGDCSCEKMQIRIAGCVMGNLQCASLGMDPSVVLKGSANVNPSGEGDNKDKRKPRGRSRQNRKKLQSRLSSDENSSRASFSSTAGFSPYSAAARTPRFGGERHSALLDDDTPIQWTRPGTQKEGGGAKGGSKSSARGKVKRRNSMGANVYGNDAQNRAVPSSHRRVYSNENLPLTTRKTYGSSMEEKTYNPGNDSAGDAQGNEALLF